MLYSEVMEKWLEKFEYAGLKGNISPADLRLDDDLSVLSEDEREKVLDLREEAKQKIRTVSFALLCHRHYR